MRAEQPPAGSSSSTRAVGRAMDLLAQVCGAGEMGLAECARRSGLAPSTALRLLRTLETSHLVVRDHHGLFRAGPRLIQLGAAALSRQSLVGTAEPALRRIVLECHDLTYLALPGPTDSAVYAGMAGVCTRCVTPAGSDAAFPFAAQLWERSSVAKCPLPDTW